MLENLYLVASHLLCLIAGMLFNEFIIDRVRRVKLKFYNRLIFYHFSESIRVALSVIHRGGKLPVTNAVGYLTISMKTNDKKKLVENHIDERFIVEKKEGSCALRSIGCNKCEGKEYLVSYEKGDKVKVFCEYVPWTVPVKSGEGINNLPYKHVTHIPVQGSAKLVLFDIYRMDDGQEEFYLIKVHSEYGDIYHPRVCLKLPLRNPPKDTLIFNIDVSGENVRGRARTSLKILYDKSIDDY